MSFENNFMDLFESPWGRFLPLLLTYSIPFLATKAALERLLLFLFYRNPKYKFHEFCLFRFLFSLYRREWNNESIRYPKMMS